MMRTRSVSWFICGLLAMAADALAQATTPTPFNPYFAPGVSLTPFRPSAALAFGGGYDLLGGYARAALTAPQPTGHEIVPTGPNGFIYRPTYATPAPAPQPVTAVLPGSDVQRKDTVLARAADDFRAGRYDDVVRATEGIVVSDPRHGLAHLLQSHGFFALGKWQEASDSLHRALWILPEQQWPAILANYRDYYRATRYTHHLRDLEQFVTTRPTDPAGRFLLGYHYGYLGYREAGAEQLAAAAELAQVDELAEALLERFNVRAAAPVTADPAPPPPPGPRAF